MGNGKCPHSVNCPEPKRVVGEGNGWEEAKGILVADIVEPLHAPSGVYSSWTMQQSSGKAKVLLQIMDRLERMERKIDEILKR